MIDAVNEQFRRFVSFAEGRMAAGKDKAIASKGDIEKGGGTTLEERKIKVSNRFDWVSLSIFRWKGARDDNNAVRELFRKCVADMFGGEKNIPESVRTAMLTGAKTYSTRSTIRTASSRTRRSPPDTRALTLESSTLRPTCVPRCRA